jgi:hypothetical protein
MAKKIKSLCGHQVKVGEALFTCNDQIPGHSAGKYHFFRDEENLLFITWDVHSPLAVKPEKA